MAVVRLTTQFDDPRRVAVAATPTCCCCCCCCVASVVTSSGLAAVEANHFARLDGASGGARSTRTVVGALYIPLALVASVLLSGISRAANVPSAGWASVLGFWGVLAIAFGGQPPARLGRALAHVLLTFVAIAGEVVAVILLGAAALRGGRGSGLAIAGLAYVPGAIALAVVMIRRRSATLSRRRGEGEGGGAPPSEAWPALPGGTGNGSPGFPPTLPTTLPTASGGLPPSPPTAPGGWLEPPRSPSPPPPPRR